MLRIHITGALLTQYHVCIQCTNTGNDHLGTIVLMKCNEIVHTQK